MIIYNRAKAHGEQTMKKLEIKLRNKVTNEVITMYCHTYACNGENYLLSGVKGYSGYNNTLTYSCELFERVRD